MPTFTIFDYSTHAEATAARKKLALSGHLKPYETPLLYSSITDGKVVQELVRRVKKTGDRPLAASFVKGGTSLCVASNEPVTTGVFMAEEILGRKPDETFRDLYYPALPPDKQLKPVSAVETATSAPVPAVPTAKPQRGIIKPWLGSSDPA